MSEIIKVAAVQAAPSFLDIDKGVARAVDYIEEAAKAGCQLVVFPETWLPGYPNQIWLGPVAWSIQFVAPYFRNSIEVGDKYDKALADAAKRNNIQVSMGLSERDGGSLYIAQWHYGEQGEIIKRRRKLKPSHVERTVFGEGDGSDLAVSATSIGRIGQLSCWEHMQPLSKYAMYSQNEQIHCAAWPNLALYEGGAYALGHQVNNAASMIYAVEGSCYVVAACALVSKEQQEILCQGDALREQLCPLGGGYSRIYAPDGQSIGTALAHTDEGLVTADLDLTMIAVAKAAADPAGHYSRPDVTRLMFNSKSQRPVVSFETAQNMISGTSDEARDDVEADDVITG